VTGGPRVRFVALAHTGDSLGVVVSRYRARTTVLGLPAAALGCQFGRAMIWERGEEEKMHGGTPPTDVDQIAWFIRSRTAGNAADGARAGRNRYPALRAIFARPSAALELRHVRTKGSFASILGSSNLDAAAGRIEDRTLKTP
jgi:hypothetical protein